jgi:enolase
MYFRTKKEAFMSARLEIIDVYAREIMDSRGNPTVEAEVVVENGHTGEVVYAWADVPSGASTGQFEAVELRDGEKAYHGKGVQKAVANVNGKIAQALIGKDALKQNQIDEQMLALDGTKNKSSLGANAVLGVSMACARACADALKLPLYRYLGGCGKGTVPVPMMNILNGGAHSKNCIDFQEFMILPVGAKGIRQGLQWCAEVYQELKKLLDEDGHSTGVGDEGGFAPDLKNTFEVLDYLMKAVRSAGFEPGRDISFAMDAAASELFQEDAAMYYFPGETKSLIRKNAKTIEQNNTQETECNCEGTMVVTEEIKDVCICETDCNCLTPDTDGQMIMRSTDEMIDYYEKLVDKYPIVSIEDPLDEEDWDGWKKITERLGRKIMLVGDDLFVTNPKRLKKGIELSAANSPF